MKREKFDSVVFTLLVILLPITSSFAQESQEHQKTQENLETDEAALAKATQNANLEKPKELFFANAQKKKNYE